MNDTAFSLLYNKENYTQQITVVKENASGNFTKPTDFSINLLNSLIKKIQIISDIKLPILVGELIFEDKNFQLYSQLKDENNKVFINVNIKKIEPPSSQQVQVIFNNQFYVTNIELMEKKLDSVYLKFEFIGIDWIKFCNNFRYSSGSKPKSYTQILLELMKQNGFPINQSVNLSNKSGSFITPTYYTLLESIIYNLKRAIDPNFGFHLISYDPIAKNYNILNSKQLYKQKILDDNKLNLPTKELVLAQQRTINTINKQNYLNKEKNMEIVKNVILKDYDYSKRTFKNDIFLFDSKITEMLPQINDNKFAMNLNRIDKNIDSGISNYVKEQLYRKFDFYTHLTDSFLYSNVIEFNTYGVLSRYAGQVLSIIVDDQSVFKNDYEGIWFLQRIYHVFTNGAYNNIIQANRLDERIR